MEGTNLIFYSPSDSTTLEVGKGPCSPIVLDLAGRNWLLALA